MAGIGPPPPPSLHEGYDSASNPLASSWVHRVAQDSTLGHVSGARTTAPIPAARAAAAQTGMALISQEKTEDDNEPKLDRAGPHEPTSVAVARLVAEPRQLAPVDGNAAVRAPAPTPAAAYVSLGAKDTTGRFGVPTLSKFKQAPGSVQSDPGYQGSGGASERGPSNADDVIATFRRELQLGVDEVLARHGLLSSKHAYVATASMHSDTGSGTGSHRQTAQAAGASAESSDAGGAGAHPAKAVGLRPATPVLRSAAPKVVVQSPLTAVPSPKAQAEALSNCISSGAEADDSDAAAAARSTRQLGKEPVGDNVRASTSATISSVGQKGAAVDTQIQLQEARRSIAVLEQKLAAAMHRNTELEAEVLQLRLADNALRQRGTALTTEAARHRLLQSPHSDMIRTSMARVWSPNGRDIVMHDLGELASSSESESDDSGTNTPSNSPSLVVKFDHAAAVLDASDNSASD